MFTTHFTALPAGLIGAGMILAAPAATANLLTFGTDDHGLVVDGWTFSGVTVSGTNHRDQFDGAAMLFDSLSDDTRKDPDLLGPTFSQGNLVDADGTVLDGRIVPGNLLVVADYLTGSESDGTVDIPSDEGSRRSTPSLFGTNRSLAGELVFEFADEQQAGTIEIGIVDLENRTESNTSIHLLLGEMIVQSIEIEAFESPDGLGEIALGDNSYNALSFEASESYDSLVLEVGGSLGVAYLSTPGFLIPTPGAAALLALAGGCCFVRRRPNRGGPNDHAVGDDRVRSSD